MQSHALRTFIFDPAIFDIPQSVIGSSIIENLRTTKKSEWLICPFTLITGLGNLIQRYKRVVLDLIMEYDIRNPQSTQVMGSLGHAPYEARYNSQTKTVTFDLTKFPHSLIIVLFQFSTLASVYSEADANSPTNEAVIKRIREEDFTFNLDNCDPAESYKRVSIPVQNTTIGKSKYDIVNPGTRRLINNAGGFSRVMERGHYVDVKGNPYDSSSSKMCWWHRHLFDGESMGIPIRIEEVYDGYNIYMDGNFCSYSCTLAYLEVELDKVYSKRNPNYADSFNLLSAMFDEHSPGEKLKASLDWKEMSDVGNGTLSLKDYMTSLKGLCTTHNYNNKYPYTVRFLPAIIGSDIVESKTIGRAKSK
tara:strand:- start:111984 stop:113069 length:1086 start_codon:yes stop_codon:yes gene_type:complete